MIFTSAHDTSRFHFGKYKHTTMIRASCVLQVKMSKQKSTTLHVYFRIYITTSKMFGSIVTTIFKNCVMHVYRVGLALRRQIILTLPQF